jgi:Xaa-Pro aminopeptidase
VSADQLYATKFRAPDAFVFLGMGAKKFLLLSDLEVDRGRSEAKADRVDAFSTVEKNVQGKKKPGFATVVAAWLKENKVRSVRVPADFPLALARSLKKEGVRIKAAAGSFWPERELKSPSEVRAIEAALRIAEAGMNRGFEILASARPGKDGRLLVGRRLLTAEALRIEIETAIVRAGGEARGDTIVACGKLACDPHARGHGPLRANELIILDIFPRDARSGYFGDITRTVVRGRASGAQRHMWETCLAGQKMAFARMKPGRQGAAIQESIRAFFARRGYPTEIRDGHWRGFFHGLGHGLGLEIHEAPRFASATLIPGQILTVEPGIYIPELGGVRHEDVALITPLGHRVLSRLPKPLEI